LSYAFVRFFHVFVTLVSHVKLYVVTHKCSCTKQMIEYDTSIPRAVRLCWLENAYSCPLFPAGNFGL